MGSIDHVVTSTRILLPAVCDVQPNVRRTEWPSCELCLSWPHYRFTVCALDHRPSHSCSLARTRFLPSHGTSSTVANKPEPLSSALFISFGVLRWTSLLPHGLGGGSAGSSHETCLCPCDTLQDLVAPSSFITERPQTMAPWSSAGLARLVEKKKKRWHPLLSCNLKTAPVSSTSVRPPTAGCASRRNAMTVNPLWPLRFWRPLCNFGLFLLQRYVEHGSTTIRIWRVYKHLGSIVSVQANMTPEVLARTSPFVLLFSLLETSRNLPRMRRSLPLSWAGFF